MRPFYGCVLLVVFLASQLGMTYEAINVWIFVIIWLAFTLALIAIVIWQRLKIRQIQNESHSSHVGK